ncbi:hypothetical protein [Streptomyces daghestanicus]|uniref:DUF2997 domain-containing protein n=1 Tax=Streptomyces daghestanicus TaxID=66885 RepID=A0ABQ3Q7R9_9ACTN|nr:hypothetical protein [Streptomyces daghestanicus]GGU62615.1 hypothetical protein GCM10010259_61570 [Streptomyces daghestanicus]GHI33311.1 hypothetical protein Sdagh_50410 [Streptomyces daghestanicus]
MSKKTITISLKVEDGVSCEQIRADIENDIETEAPYDATVTMVTEDK